LGFLAQFTFFPSPHFDHGAFMHCALHILVVPVCNVLTNWNFRPFRAQSTSSLVLCFVVAFLCFFPFINHSMEHRRCIARNM